ncbi:MAG: hypothetical protein CSA21_01100 [Deltaproteobacteria bacterium]|nr:MAG: hypothetical protein CSA21_01100 [Deltaproteobacteria bacterium]
MKIRALLLAVVLFGSMSFTAVVQAVAADKIGVINVQQIIVKSDAGKAAKIRLDEKAKEFQQKFQAEEQALVALQQEIEKKNSVWSEQKKQEKVREFQKKRRDLQSKTADARFELKQLEEKEFQPILKSLDGVIKAYGKKKGYYLIVEKNNGAVLYADKAADATDAMLKELNAAMK